MRNSDSNTLQELHAGESYRICATVSDTLQSHLQYWHQKPTLSSCMSRCCHCPRLYIYVESEFSFGSSWFSEPWSQWAVPLANQLVTYYTVFRHQTVHFTFTFYITLPTKEWFSMLILFEAYILCSLFMLCTSCRSVLLHLFHLCTSNTFIMFSYKWMYPYSTFNPSVML